LTGAAPVPSGSLVLVTGATGYVGGRLVSILLDRGYRVRCLAVEREGQTGDALQRHDAI
jgi:uncharacterized protein YbjT (DUF2867 family)